MPATQTHALGLLLLVSAFLGQGCRRDSQETSPPQSANPPSLSWFEDITEESKIQFVHRAGTTYFMPEQIGSGAAIFDCDGDGRMDVLLLQYTTKAAPQGSSISGHRLFHQEADGRFRDISEGSGLNLAGPAMGVVAGDLNNDGRPDLIITEYLRARVLQNLGGGRFKDVSAESGLDNPVWGTAISLFDYDRDGWLDVVIGNYIDYDPTQECLDARGQREFCAPKAFPPTASRLWRNAGQTSGGPIHFQDQTERSQLSRFPGVALGLICADFDGDRWPDIFCSDDGRPNRLFINKHDGTFAEEAVQRGLAFNAMGQIAANMGTAWGDFDGDGMNDVFVTHLSDEFHGLWLQGPRGLFTDRLASSQLQTQAWRGTGFGTVAADFDLDGDLDLAWANGLIRHSLPAQTPVQAGTDPFWHRYTQKPQVFANRGDGRFDDVSAQNPEFCGMAMVGRSLTVGDLNQDGAPDLLLSAVGGPAKLYRGRRPPQHHWFTLRLVEPRWGDRDAIGAEAILRVGKRRQSRLLQPATSYLCSHEPSLLFGLGTATTVDDIEVQWADGSTEIFPGGGVDQTRTLRHGEGKDATHSSIR